MAESEIFTARPNNATTIFELTSWTAAQLKSAANLTQYAPSVNDLLMVGPRMGNKFRSFVSQLPSALGDAFGTNLHQTVIPEATIISATDAVTSAATPLEHIAQASAIIMEDAIVPEPGLASKISLESGRSFGNMIAYATSRWSLGCFLMAIIINRTQVYASTRRPVSLGLRTRLILRVVPILFLLMQGRWLLQSMQCQTSPDFSMLRWGDSTKSSELMFTQSGGFLHSISSTLLFGASDAESCRAVRMVPPASKHVGTKDSVDVENLRGSLALLWPLFQTLCASQFVETLSCALQGRHVASETGMTLFEHSLAFAEADAAISSSLGWGPFGGTPSASHVKGHAKTFHDPSSSAWPTSLPSNIAITRAMIMKRINTPPEVLLIGFLSSMNHITSQILGVFNIQNRLRLVNTAFWGLCFMFTISWSILNFSVEEDSNHSLLRFPTVCIIGFIPHMLILAGIIICSIVYGFAVFLSALSLPQNSQVAGNSFLQNIILAHENMQASVPLSNIRISMDTDFYSALLKTGFSALTMASEAVYLNESLEVNIKQRTWLEDERLREVEELGAHWLGPNFRKDVADGDGLVLSKIEGALSNGYARERVSLDGGKVKPTDKVIRDGVGATERSGRWIMAFEFLFGIFKLIVSWIVMVILRLLSRFGVEARPAWLLWLVRTKGNGNTTNVKRDQRNPEMLEFWLLNSDGELMLPDDENVDVEVEMKRRLKGDSAQWSPQDEEQLDDNLYSWWLHGGWFGADDNSGQFVPRKCELEDDATSMVSISEVPTDNEWESESDENDGRRTPTQRSHFESRESTPCNDTSLSHLDLAKLLDPRTPERHAEAQALVAHLRSDTIMTRSRYRDMRLREKAKVLLSNRNRPEHLRRTGKLTSHEEAQLLEHLIITRRSSSTATAYSSGASWAGDASGVGENGPQCVVCQSAPRSIIVWPCRCLCLCDDCRVTLAMNNFDKCVCCRRDVGSFSRIFVP